MMNRRSFLTGLAAAIAAPAIVNAASLMPVRGIVMPVGNVTWFVGQNFGEIEDGTALNAFKTWQRAIDHFLSLDPGGDLTLIAQPGLIVTAPPDQPVISWRGGTLTLGGADTYWNRRDDGSIEVRARARSAA